METPDFKLLDWIAQFIPQDELSRLQKEFNHKPFRITNAYKDLFSGYEILSAKEILTITEEVPNSDYNGLVSGLNIPYLSFCEHHFLPFIGEVDVIYEPNNYILGIGKLSRLVDYRTKRFNIQENIAKQICEDLMTFGNAKGAFVRISAHHMCLCYRGPKKYQSSNVVSYSIGSCRKPEKINEIKILFK
ncbi:MAG: hypothetical protein RLZZ628_2954 [Bacteroidota bacterium]|jgi:GTP cyclohydrolase I